MSTTKITSLPVLPTANISANGAQTIFVVVDTSSGTPTTKQMSLQSLDSFVDNVGPIALAHATGAFNQANTANITGVAAFSQANAANSLAQTAYVLAITANNMAFGAYGTANTNATNISTLDTKSNTIWAQANTTANSVVSTDANVANTLVVAQAAFDAANNEVVGAAAFAKANSANVLAQQAYDAANTNGATFNSYAANTANIAWLTANAAFVQANAANSLAANAVAKTGSTMTGDLNIQSANLTITSAFGGVGGTANIAGKLTVGTPGFTVLPNLIAQFTYSTSTYSQVNQENTNGLGSGDFVVTADNGDDGNNYIDMGMAGQSYNDAAFPAYLPNDGWLIVQGKEGQGFGGNLLLGTSATNTDIVILQGGTSFDEEVARFVHGEGLVLKYNTQSTSNSTGSLVVQGGIGANGNIYADAIYAGGTNLNTRIQTVYDYANTVYDYANTISVSLNNQFITNASNTANAASAHANGAYDTANTTLSTSALAFNTANAAQVTGTAAFVQANTAFDKANAANVLAQQAYNSSNTNFSSVSNIATPAFAHANGAFDKANSANTLAQAAYDQANTAVSGYNQANTATTIAQGAFDFANTVNTYAYSAYSVANTNASTISTVSAKTNSAFDVANTALATAANALTIDNQANGAYTHANSAYNQANTATTLAGNAFDRGNTAWTQANTATTTGQAAFDKANTALANTSGTFNGNLNVTGAITIGNVVRMEYAPTASPATFTANTGGVDFVVKSNTAQWFFANTGSLTFPDNTIQTTAYNKTNSIVLVASAPSTNKGATGDKRGYVYLGNTAYYYCTADYDGTTNVWSKIDSSDAW